MDSSDAFPYKSEFKNPNSVKFGLFNNKKSVIMVRVLTNIQKILL